MDRKKITKAVIPAAGFGTRMLPLTKAIPKELLPVAGKPVIQYVVEEAISAGIEVVFVIISKGKEAIKKHFDNDLLLEERLKRKGKLHLIESIRKINDSIDIHYIFQDEQLGLGHAVLMAHEAIGHCPFAVMLGDTILQSSTTQSVTAQLIHQSEHLGSSVVGIQEVPVQEVSKYGVMKGEQIDDDLYKVKEWIEKPSAEVAPSNFVIAGRYIFTPTIWSHLEQTKCGLHNEIQLTDAMSKLLQHERCFGYRFKGRRFDIGSVESFLEANRQISLTPTWT